MDETHQESFDSIIFCMKSIALYIYKQLLFTIQFINSIQPCTKLRNQFRFDVWSCGRGKTFGVYEFIQSKHQSMKSKPVINLCDNDDDFEDDTTSTLYYKSSSVNLTLSSTSTATSSSLILSNEDRSCYVCGCDLSKLQGLDSMVHVSRCIDEAELKEKEDSMDPLQRRVFTCPVCLQSFRSSISNQSNTNTASIPSKDVSLRIKHIRQCVKKNKLSLNQYQELLYQNTIAANEPRDHVDVGNSNQNSNSSSNIKDAKQMRRMGDYEGRLASLLSAIENESQLDEDVIEIDCENDIEDEIVIEESNHVKSAFDILMSRTSQSSSPKQQQSLGTSIKTTQSNEKKRSSWWSKKAYYLCPDSKKVPGTRFIIDGFNYHDPRLSEDYFLSHFHSDHYQGLDKSFQSGNIYCSPITAKLVIQQLKVDPSRIKVLRIGTHNPNYILQSSSKNKSVAVWLLDANHCPGSVMFLFKIGDSNPQYYLHTGDFRFTPSMIPEIQSILKDNILDGLYLDTTYCQVKAPLPSQSDAVEAACKAIMDAYSSSDKTLIVIGSYTIGKERLFLEVARRLGCQIYVTPEKHRVITCCADDKNSFSLFYEGFLQKHLTTDKKKARIWILPMGNISLRKLEELLLTRSFPYKKIFSMRPTGWESVSKQKKQTLSDDGLVSITSKNASGSITIAGVAYSEHSSFFELRDFIKHMKDSKKIIPTVVSSYERDSGKYLKEVDSIIQSLTENM